MTKAFVSHLNKEVDEDAWLREVIQTHFNKETGSTYWLEKQAQLKINAIEEIQTMKDLPKLGLMDQEALKNRLVDDFLPKPLRLNKGSYRVFESGATTGAPKRIPWSTEYFNQICDFAVYNLDKVYNFPKEGNNWLYAGPTGPHIVGLAAITLASRLGSTCMTMDLDSRFVKKLIAARKMDIMGMYMDHIKEQAQHHFKTQHISVLFTTAKILEEIAKNMPVKKMGFKGILHGGLSVEPDTLKVLHEEYFPGIPIVGFYGNTLFGFGFQDIVDRKTYNLDYYPIFPVMNFSVVPEKDPWKKCKIGETGLLLGTRLSKDIFIANFLERDEVTAIGPSKNFPWNGVRNPRSSKASIAAGAIEGVY